MVYPFDYTKMHRLSIVRSIIIDLLCITLFHSIFYFSIFFLSFRFKSYYDNRFVLKYSFSDLIFLFIKSQFLVKSRVVILKMQISSYESKKNYL